MAVNTLVKTRKRTKVSGPDFNIDHAAYSAIAFTDTATVGEQIFANHIMLSSDQPCHIGIGESDIVATTNHARLPAITQFPLIISWQPGDYLSVIRSGANSGTLHVVGVY